MNDASRRQSRNSCRRCLRGQPAPATIFRTKAPKPGEYKYMTQGMLVVRELAVSFTILTNDGQQQVVQDALTMLKSATHTP